MPTPPHLHLEPTGLSAHAAGGNVAGLSGVAIDLETGGFDPACHALLSVGLCLVIADEVQVALELDVQPRPGLLIEPQACLVNGWRGAPIDAVPEAVALLWVETWHAWLSRGVGRPVPLVAHRAEFDLSFLEALRRRVHRGAQWPGIVGAPTVCTMRLAATRMGVRQVSLVAACDTFDIEHTTPHRAGADALAAARLWVRLAGEGAG